MQEMVLLNRERTSIAEALARANRTVGRRAGIIQYLLQGESEVDDFGMFKYYASLTHTSRFAPVESSRKTGSGAITWQRARVAAAGEALERYCLGLWHTDNLIQASYSEVCEHAIVPESLILFSDRQYATPGFTFSRFSHDSPICWVRGYSLVTKKPKLVPASCVYMPYRPRKGETCIQGSITTGAAAGCSLEEAILSGILEVIERDAFAIVWLNKLSVPRVDLGNVKSPSLQQFIDRIYSSNLKLTLNYITTDIGIPVFLGLLEDESGNQPFTAAGAAAHLDPEVAVLKTVEETVLTRNLAKVLVQKEMISGSFSIETFEDLVDFNDHVLLHAWDESLREARGFLLNSSRSLALEEIPNLSSKDVLENIAVCLKALSDKDTDVIVVDITTPDVEEAGFKVVKVVIPGLQPLNGNFNYRRLGGRRLYETPKTLGYTEKATQENDLNPYPHPFP